MSIISISKCSPAKIPNTFEYQPNCQNKECFDNKFDNLHISVF